MNSSTVKIIKSSLAQSTLGSNLSFRTLLKQDTIIFLFHEVSNTPSQFYNDYNLNVSPANFEQQIIAIKENFNTISPKELLEGNYTTPAALITFDDGAQGYFNNAIPILTKHQCPSLIFLNMAPIEGEIFYSGLLMYLCDHVPQFKTFIEARYADQISLPIFLSIKSEWVEEFLNTQDRESIYTQVKLFYGTFATHADLEKQKNNPYVYFGNHLYHHYNAATCTSSELKEQFLLNQQKLNQYKNSINFFSYPFGQENSCYNDQTQKTIKSLNPDAIFSANDKSFKSTNKFYYRLNMTNDLLNERELKTYVVLKKIKQLLKKN